MVAILYSESYLKNKRKYGYYKYVYSYKGNGTINNDEKESNNCEKVSMRLLYRQTCGIFS